MSTIIKGGKNEFVGHCMWCGCDFRYTNDEVSVGCFMDGKSIQCPSCKEHIRHYGEHGTSEHGATGFGLAAYYQNARADMQFNKQSVDAQMQALRDALAKDGKT